MAAEHCEVDHCNGPADVLLPTITFPVALCWHHAEWVLPSKMTVLARAAGAETLTSRVPSQRHDTDEASAGEVANEVG